MITRIEVNAFKRFRTQKFQLAPLTVLAGLNGSGKTSLIQSLLLLQEFAAGARKAIRLNGPFGLELGTAEDVQNWQASGLIEINISAYEDLMCSWKLQVPSANALFLNVLEAPEALPTALTGRARAFTYLSAERYGPRVRLESSAVPAEDLEVGYRGENCAHMLSVLGNSPFLTTTRSHPERSPEPTLLKYEVEHWLSEIVRPIEIDAVESSEAMASSLKFRTPGGEWVRAPNMGFGVSYALPIVLAGLTALDGGLLVVENPEAHLHPAGQSRMGVFLAWLASRGVQVLVETHSDHLLNGIRLAISKYSYLDADSAIAHFFDSGPDGGADIKSMSFSPNGSLSCWPEGFFDQYQMDVSALGRIRRKR